MIRPAKTSILCAAFFYAAACGDVSTEPVNTSLVGVWKLVGYQEGDRIASPSGTWVFFDDGFMALDLQFEFPDGPPGFFAATGDFTQIPSGVIFRIRRSRTVWSVEFRATEAILRKTDPPATSDRLTLQRY